MPKDDINTPRYKLIEEIAKSRGWDKAETFFANMVDEEEEEMNEQLNASEQVQVLLKQLSDAKDALVLSNQQRSEDRWRFENQGMDRSRNNEKSSQNLKNY